ncbi:MAG: ABC transporter permease [Bacteroidales bacterium]
MRVNYKVSWIHLTSKVRQFVVAILSVTFGISMYVFMNSFTAGVNRAQTEITFMSLAHIRIYNDLPDDVPILLPQPENTQSATIVSNARNIRYTEGIKNTDPILETLSKMREVTAATCQINQNVFIRNGVSQYSATLSGIETETDNILFKTADFISEGDYFDLDKRSDGIILGLQLAKNLGVGMGDYVTVQTSDGVSKKFRVIALFDSGSATADKTKAMISIGAARQLLRKNRSYATDILVHVNDYLDAEQIALKTSNFTDYKVESWQEGNRQLESANVIRDLLGMAVSLTILIVAGFGIYNIMNMTVNEKIREIAILKAMGFNGKDIVEIFLSQSLIIGIAGGIVGLLLGNIFTRIVSHIPFKIASYESLPIGFNLSDYILAFLVGIIITLLAGYFPARRASRVDPVSILRG